MGPVAAPSQASTLEVGLRWSAWPHQVSAQVGVLDGFPGFQDDVVPVSMGSAKAR